VFDTLIYDVSTKWGSINITCLNIFQFSC